MTCTKCGATDRPIAWAKSAPGGVVEQALCLVCLEIELLKIKEG